MCRWCSSGDISEGDMSEGDMRYVLVLYWYAWEYSHVFPCTALEEEEVEGEEEELIEQGWRKRRRCCVCVWCSVGVALVDDVVIV